MAKYEVEPKSRQELRLLARVFRYKLGLENEIYFPIVEMLDVLCELYPKFSYEIVDDSCFPKNVHADTDVVHQHIRIKESVYEGAINGNGRDRMTIAHEIGHYITICFYGFKLQRNFNKNKIPSYKSPEWQAKCFAGELLIDYELTKNMNPLEIANACGVSRDAADYQYQKMHKK